MSLIELTPMPILRRIRSVVCEAEPFTLDNTFIEKYVGRQPAWGPIGFVTYRRTYARGLDTVMARIRDLGRRYKLTEYEEFWLTCVRVVEGCFRLQQQHAVANRLPWSNRKAQKSAEDMFERMWTFKWLPPGRGLWTMGTERVLDGRAGASAFNCAFCTTANIDTDFSGPFTWAMDMSMLGVGVGFDCDGAGKLVIQNPEVDHDETFVVEDSREGWVMLLRRVLDSYAGHADLPGNIDYAKVRPYGAPIKGFGGTASGPDPLKELVATVHKILQPLVSKTITSSAIVDLFNVIGRCVVAGNVRRSALIALGAHNDDAFGELKDYTKNPERQAWGWASNNSIIAERGMDYTDHAARTVHNGEPGYFWRENARYYGRMTDAANDRDRRVGGVNPCGEITLEDRELCNICSVYPVAHESYDDFERTIKMAYLYNKTVTLIATHDSGTNAVMLRNRRIGVSAAGVVQAENKLGRRTLITWLDRGYKYIQQLDTIYSDWLCIPKSIKTTTTKPDGTTALLMGASPGVHFPHDEFYFRVIRFDSGSPIVKAHRDAGYRCEIVEDEPNTTAVYFPVKESFYKRGKSDVSMWEQLELAAQIQGYWADNAVSVTVTFRREEAKDIANALSLYEARLKSVSFLPYVPPAEEATEFARMGYKHAPYQAVDAYGYARYANSLKPVRLDAVGHEVTEKFCDGDKCTVPVKL
jgi:adenosylcobalamin-dependent ribonucleoside-triphosphate reductase